MGDGKDATTQSGSPIDSRRTTTSGLRFVRPRATNGDAAGGPTQTVRASVAVRRTAVSASLVADLETSQYSPVGNLVAGTLAGVTGTPRVGGADPPAPLRVQPGRGDRLGAAGTFAP